MSARGELPPELGNGFEDDMKIDSWLSEQLRHRRLLCPHCHRNIRPDPLIRSSVMFMEWEDLSNSGNPTVFYV